MAQVNFHLSQFDDHAKETRETVTEDLDNMETETPPDTNINPTTSSKSKGKKRKLTNSATSLREEMHIFWSTHYQPSDDTSVQMQ